MAEKNTIMCHFKGERRGKRSRKKRKKRKVVGLGRWRKQCKRMERRKRRGKRGLQWGEGRKDNTRELSQEDEGI